MIDELDLRDVVLVVHDWGGPIGLGAMLERVDRLRGLVIMNTWAWELPSFLPPFVREFRNEGLGEILALGGNLFVESIPGGMHTARDRPGDDGRLPRALPGLLVTRRHARVPARHPADRARPQRLGLIASIHERLGDVDVPVLLVWGMRDRVFQPVFLDQWRELFPDARSVELDDAGHFLVEDRPEAVTASIGEFLRPRVSSQRRSDLPRHGLGAGLLRAVERRVGLGVQRARVERARLGDARSRS